MIRSMCPGFNRHCCVTSNGINVMGIPEWKTICAGVRVNINIELRQRMILPLSRIAPPMMTSFFTASANFGSLRIAIAMFVSGRWERG